MVDLFYFMIILMVFVGAFGISSQVILYPNSPLDINLAFDVLRSAWWYVFQQFNIQEVSGANCTNSSATASRKIHNAFTCAADGYDTSTCLNKEDQCPAIDWLMPILLAFYALITQVMMMNLLIAMFSNTFTLVQKKTNSVWKMQRYHLVKEFDTKSALVPPFVIIFHIYFLFCYLSQGCNFSKTNFSQSTFRFKYTKANEREEKDLIDWERVHAVEHLRKADAAKRDTLERQVSEMSDRVKSIVSKVDVLAERGTTTLSGSISTTVSKERLKLHPMLETRLVSMEGQVKRTLELVDTIAKLMKEMNSRPAAAAWTEDVPDVENRQVWSERRQKANRRKTIPLMQPTECRNSNYPTSKLSQEFRPVPDKSIQFDDVTHTEQTYL
jgi:hypothetical protein